MAVPYAWKTRAELNLKHEHSNGQAVVWGCSGKTRFCNPVRFPLITHAPSHVYPTSCFPIHIFQLQVQRDALIQQHSTIEIFHNSFVYYLLTVESCDFRVMSDVSSKIITTKVASWICRMIPSTKTAVLPRSSPFAHLEVPLNTVAV